MSDDGIVATTLLAGNCDEALLALCESFTAGGIVVRFDVDQPVDARRRAVFSGRVDLVWLCGLLAARAIADGRLDGAIRLAPVFAGRAAPVYQSVIVARAGSGLASLADAAGTRLAVNEYESWSGYHALKHHLESRRRSMDLFAARVVTGSHRESVRSVRQQATDLAAIDETVWRWLPPAEVDGLVVIDRTGPAPSPPLVMGATLAGERALAVEDAARWIRTGQLPGVDRFAPVTAAEYAPMLVAGLTDPRVSVDRARWDHDSSSGVTGDTAAE